MSTYKVCPEYPGSWKTEAAAHKVGSIHEFKEVDSASSLGVEQFLALKVLWKVQTNISVLKDTHSSSPWLARLGTTRQEILDMGEKLKKDTEWKMYLETLQESGLRPNASFSTKLGRFAMVLQNQTIVTKLSDAKSDDQKVWTSPMKLRSGLKLGVGDPQLLQFNPTAKGAGSESGDPQRKQPSPPRPESRSSSNTESPSSKGKQRSSPSPVNKLRSAAESDDTGGKQQSPPRPQSRPISVAGTELSKTNSDITVTSQYDFDMSKEERAGMADEQVVNTAAISFLQSLFVHEPRNAYWSPQRKGFRFGKTSFKALTDGHLQITGETRSAAILEVKARTRPHALAADYKIEWQESAQMALWIRDEPSSFWTTEKEPNIRRWVSVRPFSI
jgi:hypothetical protein